MTDATTDSCLSHKTLAAPTFSITALSRSTSVPMISLSFSMMRLFFGPSALLVRWYNSKDGGCLWRGEGREARPEDGNERRRRRSAPLAVLLGSGPQRYDKYIRLRPIMTASTWFPPVIPFDLRLHPCSLPLYIKPSLTQSTQSLVLTNLNLNPKLPGSASARKQSRAV